MTRRTAIAAIAVTVLAAAIAGGTYYILKAGKYPQPQAQALAVGNATSDDDIFDQSDETPSIEIPEGAVRLMAVRSVPAQVMPIRHTIRTVGRIEVDEKRLHNVNAKVEGWIEKLFVDYTGKPVKKGEAVAEVYSPELLATQQELLDSIKWERKGKKPGDYSGMIASDARAVTKAARQRLRLWDISERQIDAIIKSGKPMRTLAVHSPADGVVIEKSAVLGAKIMPGEKLYTIADLSSIWVIADVYESEMHYIKPGMEALITMGHLPGVEIKSRVDFIYPSLDNTTRTLQVRFEVKNPTGELKPSMYTDIALQIDLGQRLAVPKTALIDSGQRQVVYVDKGSGYYEPREISTGIAGDTIVEVTAGIEPGEMVAESGTFLLDSEAQLKGVRPLDKAK